MQQLPWHKAIEQVLRDNDGVASLEVLYRDIVKYRDVTTNREWKATLRGILYREMQQKGYIVKVGLGVFALRSVAPKRTLFQRIVHGKEIKRKHLSHTDIEGMLVELGNFYGYDTYTADAKKFFDGKPLVSLATLKDLPPFTGFPDLLEQVRRIDVLWFERKPRAFPKFAFEVETTPDFRRALLRLYQLRDFDTALYVISNAAKRNLFEKRLLDEPFHILRHRFVFRSFDDVLNIYQLQVQLVEEEERFFANLIRRRR
jgi:hypothetical protein